jgi:hypothetical protein
MYAPQVKDHLRAVERRHYSLIRQTIEEQLRWEPDVETRNRKPLKRAPAAGKVEWEIRFGPENRFRVFYDIDREQRCVRILAVGIKAGHELTIEGRAVTL